VTVVDAARQDQSLHGFVVLVVDDDSVAVEVVSALIADAFGCLILCAASAEEALRTIDSGLHVDLVFSDVVMPKVDGVWLAREIRKRRRHLPVVLTTGRPDFVDWIVNRGGVALIKPYSIERLKAVFTEQLCPPSPESTSSQTRVVVKRTRRKTIDRRQIDLKDSTDVRYWCRRFSCTQSALRAAIKLLGTDPASIEKHLMTKRTR